MKKITYLILFIVVLGHGQDNKTIYVSNNQNVLLFFDSPILQGICGHSNYQFAFDINEQKKYGIIKGQKGVDSNLHIITNNGNVYSFVLKYKSNITKINYFITSKDAVGNTNGNIIKSQNSLVFERDSKNKEVKNMEIVNDNNFTEEDYSTPEKDKSKYSYNKDRNSYFKKYCSNLTSQPAYFKRFFIEHKGLIMYLEEINYNQNELYFKLRVVNKTSIDYETNFLSFSKIGKKNSKKKHFTIHKYSNYLYL